MDSYTNHFIIGKKYKDPEGNIMQLIAIEPCLLPSAIRENSTCKHQCSGKKRFKLSSGVSGVYCGRPDLCNHGMIIPLWQDEKHKSTNTERGEYNMTVCNKTVAEIVAQAHVSLEDEIRETAVEKIHTILSDIYAARKIVVKYEKELAAAKKQLAEDLKEVISETQLCQ